MFKKFKFYLIKKFFIKKRQFKNEVSFSDKKFFKINEITRNKIVKIQFGNKNKNKNFFVIKRSPGGGFFSNLLFVLDNLHYCEKKKYIPIIDMENFPTKYNHKKNIFKIKNIWNLYFKPLNNYKLSEVYKSKNVFFSKDKTNIWLEDFFKKKYQKLFKKYIKINPKILKDVEHFKKKFLKKKILALHFRGTDQRLSPGHAIPPSIYQIYQFLDNPKTKKKYDKIFLVTEDKNYFLKLKKKFNNLIYLNSFRAKEINEFNTCKRKYHRNKLGEESLKEAILMSYCNTIVYCKTNISLFSIFYSNYKINKIEFNQGYKSKNVVKARFEFIYKVLIPSAIKYFFNIKSY